MAAQAVSQPLQTCTRCHQPRKWLLPVRGICAMCLSSYTGRCEPGHESAAALLMTASQ